MVFHLFVRADAEWALPFLVSMFSSVSIVLDNKRFKALQVLNVVMIVMLCGEADRRSCHGQSRTSSSGL